MFAVIPNTVPSAPQDILKHPKDEYVYELSGFYHSNYWFNVVSYKIHVTPEKRKIDL